MTLPQFWFEPLENLLEDVVRRAEAALGAALAEAAGARMLVLVLGFIGAEPREIDEWPPAGA